MEIKELDQQEIEAIYKNQMQRDFPLEEIRPWNMFLRSFSCGLYLGYGLFENGELLSYATFTFSSKNSSAILLDYYAVSPSMRGKGIGQRFLTALAQMLDETKNISLILLEVENPEFSKNSEDLSVRRRRIEFYKRCGACLSNINSKVFEADFSIMYISKYGEKSDSQIYKALDEIYSSMFEKDLLKKYVCIFD